MRTSSPSPWIIRLSVSIYRSLLRSIGPTSYFRPYGDLTIQLFRECCQDAYQKHGTIGVLSLWLPSFSDLIVQMVLEVLCERQHTSRPHISVKTVVSALAVEYFSAPIENMRRFIYRLRWPFILKRAQRQAWLMYPTNMHFEQQLEHWKFMGGPPLYESGIDTRMPDRAPGAFLKSIADTETFAALSETFETLATLRQTIKADNYRGKHLRFSGDVKVEQVEQQAGLWIEPIVQSLPHRRAKRLKPENELQGTHAWMSYEDTIFIPDDAIFIRFGLVLHGRGQAWLANTQLEVIEHDGMLSA